MKIAMFSSVLNHHQIEFCDYMYERYGEGFTFVSTMEIEEQRVKLGYKLFNRKYNLPMFQSLEQREKAEKLFLKADVVILDVYLEKWLQRRLKENKLTFLFKEHLFKEKPSIYRYLRSCLFVWREYSRYWNRSLYILAASSRTFRDFHSMGFPTSHFFTWGYYPPLLHYDEKIMEKNKEGNCLRILWVGRLIEFKHPQYAIRVAEKLRNEGIPFHMDVVGLGPLEDELKAMISSIKIGEFVSMVGAVTPQQVREYMEKANIFLFTSDRGEGFGAVLSEAMNSGCAVIASKNAGATDILVKDGINGRIYKNDNVLELEAIAIELAKNLQEVYNLGQEAYRTIVEVQNARVAAKRFSDCAEAVLKGDSAPYYVDGPMSRRKNEKY